MVDTFDALLQLVRTRLTTDGRAALARAMGYQNIAKGIRRLEAFIARHHLRPDVAGRLALAFGFDPAEVITLTANEERRLAEAEAAARIARARAALRPHLFVTTERTVPSPLTIGLICDCPRLRYVPVELTEPTPEAIGDLIRVHFAKHRGELHFWGRILSYRYQKTFDHAWLFDTDGRFLTAAPQRCHLEPSSGIFFKGRAITLRLDGDDATAGAAHAPRPLQSPTPPAPPAGPTATSDPAAGQGGGEA